MNRWMWILGISIIFGIVGNAIMPSGSIGGLIGTIVGFFILFYGGFWILDKLTKK